ncbi:MAG: hypothetical protein HYY23_12980, partial [Verrucomicrobia bacterium]|nr:hypothetical protein [Verrucomicrobiota bacterium]
MKTSRFIVLGFLLLGLPQVRVNAANAVVESINRVNSTPINASTVTWTVTFSKGITGPGVSNFSLSPTLSGASIATVSGNGKNWDVTATTGSGDGPLRLNMVNDTGLNKEISNLPFAGQTYTIDKTPPSVAISAPSRSFANFGPVTYTVTYSDSNFATSTLTAANVTLIKSGTANGSVSVGGSGTTRTVTISSLTGNGTLRISIAAGTARDLAWNLAPAAGPSQIFTVDNTAPTVTISAPSGTFANTGPVTYTVTYADANFASSTLSPANVTLNKPGGSTANGIVSVTGSGSTRTVTLSSITGNGPLGISIAAGTATDLAGNPAPAAGPSTTFTVDNIAPTVAISAPSRTITATSDVSYTVTYADANLSACSLTAANVTLNATGPATGSVSVTGSGATRIVTISGLSGNGLLSITLAAGAATDLAGNAAPSATSASFIVDNTAPSVTISAPSCTISSTGPVTYTVTYSDANFGSSTLTAANVTLNKSGSANGTVGVSGSGNPRTVTISSITGNGSLWISLAAGTATDLAGNLAPAATSTAFAVDNTPPSVSISAPSASVTANGPVSFTVSYSDANFNISTLSAANVTLVKSGNADGTVSVSGSGSTRTVTISSITGDGSLGISLAAGTATDLAGNLASAAGPSTTFSVDHTIPTLTASAPSSALTTGGPVTYTLTYSDPLNPLAVMINFSASAITLNSTGTATGSISVSGLGNTRTVTVSSITGDGTIGISIAAGAATDLAGNPTPAATGSAFTVDNTTPNITVSAPGSSITAAGPVSYTVTYSDLNFSGSTLSAGNVTLVKNGGADGSVSVSGSGNTRTVTVSGITGNGSLGIAIASGTAADLAGNLAPATTGTTFAVDNTPPAVTISAPSSSFTATGPVTFNVSYSDLNFSSSTLTAAGVSLSATGSATGTVSVTGSGTSYTVAISNLSGEGALGISLAAGTATDLVGNSAPAASSTTFTVDNTAPAVAISAPSKSIAAGGSVTYTVTYSDANFNASTLTAANVSLDTTETASGTVTVTGSGTSYTVTISSLTGNGTLGFTLAPGTATDRAGNAAPALSSSTFKVDNTAPTVTISPPSSTLTASASVTYTVDYADANFNTSTLTAANVTLNKTGTASGTASVTGSGGSFTVTISGITGDGTLGISLPAGTATDLAANSAPAVTSATFTVDNNPPSVTIGGPSSSFATTGPVTFTVTYSDSNFSTSTLTAGDVTLNKSGTASGTVSVSGSGITRIVTISGITGDGTVGISLAANTAQDLAGQFAPAAGPSQTFVVDNSPPAVTLSPPSSSFTRVGPVTYTVTYTDMNFDESTLTPVDVALNATGSATGTSSVSGSGNSRVVTLSGIAGDGTLRISLAANTASDLAGNPAPAGSSTTFTVDNTPPAVAIGAPSKSITAGGSVSYSVSYADANLGATTLTAADVALNKTGTANGTIGVTGSGTSYTVIVSNITGDGSLGISLAANTAPDLAGNLAPAATSATFTVDNTAPGVTIGAPSKTSTAGGPVSYAISYADAYLGGTTLSAADVTLDKTGTANGNVGVTGSGTSFTVTISNIIGDGTLGISVAANTATDQAGNPAPAATSATFTVDNTAPTVTIGAASKSITATGAVTYSVSYADTSFGASTLTAA